MTETAWYEMTAEEALQKLDTAPEGLSPAEAAERLQRYGPNTLKEEKRISPWQILFAQFKNFLILLLIAVICDVGAWGGGRSHWRARAS